MKIASIEVFNFRLLQRFRLDLESDLSLVLGKNNAGKTSLLSVLDKFINSSDRNRITFDDFNVDLRERLIKLVSGEEDLGGEEEFEPLGITLKLFIKYDADDDLAQVAQLIMSLDPDDDNIILSFEYVIGYVQLLAMRDQYRNTSDKYDGDPSLFLKENQHEYFDQIRRKSLSSVDHSVFTDLTKEKISLDEVVSFKSISAKRSVTNKENDKTLSTQTATIYKKTSESQEQQAAVEEFKRQLRATDKDLSGIYQAMFSGVLGRVAKFGGAKLAETNIKIASTLQHRELLDGNTTVMYSHDSHDLPEHFNGLGYMNLISMIFEIEMLMTSFRRSIKERPAAINLLFVEEPEAHTHPQMQYVFIKNIKSLLKESRKREDGIEIRLQTVISTHSSHIVSECDFDDIKYLRRLPGRNGVDAKNLKDLKFEYRSEEPLKNIEAEQHYKFLKQYLTLNRAELFFADKAILIEGETERVLLPAMMRKLDQEYHDEAYAPLLSQNISLVEVGAHSQIFERFIHFIGIKALILTDIDSGFTRPLFDVDGITPLYHQNGSPKKETKKCTPNDPLADHTSNGALVFYHGKQREDLIYFLSLQAEGKSLSKIDGKWEVREDGYLFIAYQTEEDGCHGRSFEDAFFSINKEFLGRDASKFPSLTQKWFDEYVEGKCDVFVFSEKAVGSKPSLAIEILLNSVPAGDVDFSNWRTPHYIQEGLEWLRK
ncbi:ATP-dependent nuclease [Pseudomonas protegens]|uniref:ATP-dependent nuclease n=1 Tax=Pseudomonas protegens TaxID=380021 RepID=UPI0032F0333A